MPAIRDMVLLSAQIATGSSAARSYPVSLVMSAGYWWSQGRTYYQDTFGEWWSSTSMSNVYAYMLGISASGVGAYPSNDLRTTGFALRWL